MNHKAAKKFIEKLKSNKAQGNVPALMALALIFGIGLAAVALVIFSLVAGQTFQSSEATLNAISDSTVKAKAKDAATSGFFALDTTGDFLPVYVGIAILAALVAVFYGGGFMGAAGSGGRGTAL